MQSCMTTSDDQNGDFSVNNEQLSVNAQTVPVKVGFAMVKCQIFNINRCARTMVSMSMEQYNMLGSPAFAEFSYYALRPGTFSRRERLVLAKFGDIDMEINGFFNEDYGRYDKESYTMSKICFDKNCQDTEIDTNSQGTYTYKSLKFTRSGSKYPVRIGFRKVKNCNQFYGATTYCNPTRPRAIIEITSETYEALGRPVHVYFEYYESYKYPTLKAPLVANSKGEMYAVKTDFDHTITPEVHYSFVLNRFCLDKVGCLNTNIKDESYRGGYIEKILNFKVPQNSYDNL